MRIDSGALGIVSILNLAVFLAIEYLHVLFRVGFWDSMDIAASLVGIALAAVISVVIRRAVVGRKSPKSKADVQIK